MLARAERDDAVGDDGPDHLLVEQAAEVEEGGDGVGGARRLVLGARLVEQVGAVVVAVDLNTMLSFNP